MTLGLLTKHIRKSRGGSFNWYSFTDNLLADIFLKKGEGLLPVIGMGRLNGTRWYVCYEIKNKIGQNIWAAFCRFTADLIQGNVLIPK